MSTRKHIVLFGAGKSASVLIGFLKNIATQKQWSVTVADGVPALANVRVGQHPLVQGILLDINDVSGRQTLIRSADVVISLMPPSLHYLIAVDCINFNKHLLTASYIDDRIQALAEHIQAKELLFLCEMGLDPGIDHMSAMQLIHRIQNNGGNILTFRSHCGGLVAPECDNNPWHYKISWNPRNVVLAGKSGAVWRENGAVQERKYEDMFKQPERVGIEGLETLAFYPNRNSLSYMDTYQLHNAYTFIRTTLRHPAFCTGWQNIVALKLTDDHISYQTNGTSPKQLLLLHLSKHGLLPHFHQLESDPLFKEQFSFLGWYNEEPLDRGLCTAAIILQLLLENKLALQPQDKDMIVMLHEISYEIAGDIQQVKSSLIVKGEDNLHTAMAKTVGLPLGIAAVLLLEEKIALRGLQIPTVPAIYEPVLEILKTNGIAFNEA